MNKFLSETELRQRAVEWARVLGIGSDALPRLRAPGLCVLDMQNDFLRADGAMPVWGGRAIIPEISTLLRAFRVARRPVFFSRHVCLDPAHSAHLGVAAHIQAIEGLLREGSLGVEIADEIRPISGENIITKYRYSAFFGSPLELLLRAHGIQDLVIAGVVTNVCCETTAHDAFFRDFGVIFVLDATGAFDEASHLASLATIRQSYGQIATAAQVCQALDRARSDL